MIKEIYEKPQITINVFLNKNGVATDGGIVLPSDNFETTTNRSEIILPPEEFGK